MFPGGFASGGVPAGSAAACDGGCRPGGAGQGGGDLILAGGGASATTLRPGGLSIGFADAGASGEFLNGVFLPLVGES